MVWTEINPGVWKPSKDGDEISGVLVSKEEGVGNDGKGTLYHLDDGSKIISVWGSKILDDRMKFVELGKQVKIVFVRKDKNKKGQDLNIFKVFVQ